MKYSFLIVLVLTACGTSQTIQPAATEVVNTAGTVSYSLTATLGPDGSKGASLRVSQSASVTMPKTISAIDDPSYCGRADLTIGSTFCSYQSDEKGVYVRQDGSCNTFTPDSAIEVKPGDTVSLSLEGSSKTQVSVEATISGVSN